MRRTGKHATLHRHSLANHQDSGEFGFDHQATKPLADDYHSYSALWTRDEIVFGFDGRALGVIDTHGVIRGTVNIRLSTALGHCGGLPPANPTGLTMDVKHVCLLTA